MGTEEVWGKFLPKMRKGNYNSNLSQMSTSSLISKDGRLSLSSRVMPQDAWKTLGRHQEPPSTTPRPSTPKNSSRSYTPRSTPKDRTPSTAGKRSSKKNTPSDGKTQTSLHSYFPVSATKKCEPYHLRAPEVVEVTLYSSSDEENNVLSERNQEKPCEKAGVSRVLFPSTSTTTDKNNGEMARDTCRSLSPRGRDKENFSSPTTPPKSTECVKITTEKLSGDATVFKKKTWSKSQSGDAVTSERWQACRRDQQTTIRSPAAQVECEVPSCSVGPGIAPSPEPVASSQLGNLVKKMENQPKLQNDIDKGKNKMNNYEISKDSRGGEVYNLKIKKRTKVNSKQSAENICPNSPFGDENIPLGNNTQSAKRLGSLHEPLLRAPVENFTGVTECIDNDSSGNHWTPGSLSSCSSSEFDDTYPEKTATTKKRRTKKIRGNGKNNNCKNEKNKRLVCKNMSTSKPVRKDKMNTTKKETVQNTSKVKSVANLNGLSTVTSLSCISSRENISQTNTLEAESFTDSGGFFPEDEHLERPLGQAFVMKSPSVEYLENYGSFFDDSSIAVEKDRDCSDNESEKSSVLADIKAIDTLNSSSVTFNQPLQKQVSDEDLDDLFQDNFSASTLPANYDMQNLYQDDLRGVTLTESEWNKLPSQTNGNKIPRVIIEKVDYSCESLASTQVNCVMKSTSQATFISQSEMIRGRQASQDMLTERAVSPNEGEVAPFNGIIAGSRQSACQPGASNRAVMSPYSHGVSSQSTEIRLSSSIDPPQPIQNVSPNKEDVEERLASTQKVLGWISKLKFPATGCASPIGESSVTRKVRSSDKQHSALKIPGRGNENGIQKNYAKENPTQSKTCNILCQIQVFITSSYKKQGGRVDIMRKNCVVKNGCQKISDKFRKTAAVLTAEVFEISGNQSIQPRCENSKSQQNNNSNRDCIRTNKANQLLNQRRGSVCSDQEHDLKIISVKAKATYGKWGWQGLEIECLNENSESSYCDDRLESSMLSIQKVCINLCKCSRSLLVVCIVTDDGVGVECNSVGRSKFLTSLKDHESCWGVPDNPVTLSAVAYSKISNISSDKMANSNFGCANPSVGDEPNIMDALSQVLRELNEDTPKPRSRKKFQVGTVGIRNSAPVDSQAIQQTQETGDSSLSDLDDAISTASSDIEWMTQEGEASKCYAVDQWKSLMNKMRDGRKALKTTSESSLTLTDTTSSSFVSSSSQGTYSGRGHQGRVGYGQDRRSRVCPFYKKIEGTRFAVDAFSYGSIPGITHYFLSHFHYDHYMGLNKNFSYPIYCSSVTAKLVALKLGVKPHLIRRINPGQTIKVDNVTVTALDANHCPGSLMLLFQLAEGRTHLHVGDFRAHLGMESYEAFWNVRVDRLYLDTTYCNPTYTFSSQERAIDNVLSIIDSAIFKDHRTLIICGSYTIGKERVFAAISERFQFKVWAPADKRKVLECVREGLQELRSLDQESPGISEGGAARELQLVGTLCKLCMVKEDAQVHVLPMAKINGQALKDHLFSMKNLPFTNIVAFRPTGWAHGRIKGSNESNLIFNSNSVKIYEVAYSEHSSFQEMARFVKFIKPETVVKTVVGSARECEVMDVHINSWLREARLNVPVPNRITESPKSFQVAAKQREAGDFVTANKRKNVMDGRLSTSPRSSWKLFSSNNVQNSSASAGFTGSHIESIQTEGRASFQSQLKFCAKKRIGSPLDRERTPKKCHK